VTTNTRAMNDKDEITNNLSEGLVHPRSGRYREKEKKFMYVNVYVMKKRQGKDGRRSRLIPFGLDQDR
jgi:hypothetical protein